MAKSLTVVALCASCALMQMVLCISMGSSTLTAKQKVDNIDIADMHDGSHQVSVGKHSTVDGTLYNEKKMTAANEHKSTDESVNENQGNVINEKHNVKTEETGEIHKTANDEDDTSSFHEDGAAKTYSSKSHDSNKDSKRSFEKGFHNQYHKNEYHKLLQFFGNAHKGGEYIKYGNHHEKKSSDEASSEKGKHGSSFAKETEFANKKKLKQ